MGHANSPIVLNSIQGILKHIASRLAEVSQTPALDAQVLLAHILGTSRTWIMAHPEATLSDLETAFLADALARLESGEPLPYVLGHWEFYGMQFNVSPAVLIPRPETELLVDKALAWLKRHPDRTFTADIGTGSSCIAIALAKNHPGLRIIASDISEQALRVAQTNIHQHGVTNQIHCVRANIFPPTQEKFDLVCSNLPYIPTETLKRLKVHRWEPRVALHGGLQGLDLLRDFLTMAPQFLSPNGLLLMEIEANQGETVCKLARNSFPAARLELITDLAGLDRVIVVENSPDLSSNLDSIINPS